MEARNHMIGSEVGVLIVPAPLASEFFFRGGCAECVYEKVVDLKPERVWGNASI